jgi:hypothetical protein
VAAAINTRQIKAAAGAPCSTATAEAGTYAATTECLNTLTGHVVPASPEIREDKDHLSGQERTLPISTLLQMAGASQSVANLTSAKGNPAAMKENLRELSTALAVDVHFVALPLGYGRLLPPWARSKKTLL